MTRATEGERAALSSSLKGMLSLHDSAASPTLHSLHGSRGILGGITRCVPPAPPRAPPTRVTSKRPTSTHNIIHARCATMRMRHFGPAMITGQLPQQSTCRLMSFMKSCSLSMLELVLARGTPSALAMPLGGKFSPVDRPEASCGGDRLLRR